MDLSGEGQGQGDGQGDYLNDVSQRAALDANGSVDRRVGGGENGVRNAERDAQSKLKRIACILCRKRKLRCDGARPICGTCNRLSHDCAYDEARKKSGPKRGYVKLLEARLQQVEILLQSQDPAEQQSRSSTESVRPILAAAQSNGSTATQNSRPCNLDPSRSEPSQAGVIFDGSRSQSIGAENYIRADTSMVNDGFLISDSSPWEMIGLGLEEPLPLQETMDDLHRIYFDKIHPTTPIIHKGRYFAACCLSPQMRPSICLRYAMWCTAASVTDKYEALTEHFYHRARKYAQLDEMKGHGEGIISLQHCQAWIVIALYEYKNMYFPRAWQSVGRAVRTAQMLGLHRIDGSGLDVKQCLAPPKDWIETEERRRAFWLAFCEDRYASCGTGWPIIIDERDIMTNLPASEAAFQNGQPEATMSLDEALKPSGAARLSSTSGSILATYMLGRNLTHVHRPTPDDKDYDLNGEFWRRHRRIEGMLSHIALSLPDTLRLPAGLPDPNVVFINMTVHTSIICLHQAAIFKAEKHKLPASVSSESRVSCVTAAAEIARIMRMLSTLDLSLMNPFLAFCLYVAARVFIQYLKIRSEDEQMTASLQFLLAALHALKRRNPLAESFLTQLDADLQGTDIEVAHRPSGFGKKYHTTHIADSLQCSPLYEIRDSQNRTPDLNTNDREGFPQNSTQSHQCAAKTIGPSAGKSHSKSPLEAVSSSFEYNPASNTDLSHHELPSRNKSFGFSGTKMTTLADSLSTPGSDEGRSPNTLNNDHQSTRSSSYKDSSSRTSFTPPSVDDSQQNQQIPPTSRIDSSSNFSTQSGMASATNMNYYSSVDTNFSNFQANFIPLDTGVLPMQTGWEMSGIELGSGDGITSLTDQPWSQMLDGIQDWGGGFPTDDFNEDGGRRWVEN